MEIAQLLARPHDMSVGGAARYLEGFATEMASVGYAPLTIGGYLDSTIHFSEWLQARGLSLTDVDEKIVKAFGAHRCKCPGRRSHPSVSGAYVARVERFVRYLGQQGVIRSTVNSAPEAPSCLIAFREWLLQHRGLAPMTVDRHEQLMKQMLPALGADAGQYTAATVKTAVLDQIRGRRPAYAKTFVGARLPAWPRPRPAHRGGMEAVRAAAVPRLRASRRPHRCVSQGWAVGLAGSSHHVVATPAGASRR
jgi:hypothetical protein